MVDTGAIHPWGEWIQQPCECMIEQQGKPGSCRCFAVVQVGEDMGIPIYSEVEMSRDNKPRYRWRPATAGDIGSIARFGDTDHEQEPWTYGLLADIQPNPDDACDALKWVYQCDDGNWEKPEDREFFFYCQIQYDANKEP